MRMRMSTKRGGLVAFVLVVLAVMLLLGLESSEAVTPREKFESLKLRSIGHRSQEGFDHELNSNVHNMKKELRSR